jgi:ADP-heptose:LPS heptosyltransferase
MTTGGPRTLAAIRPDGMGDVLLTGPAVRAMSRSGRVAFLAGPAGAAAAELLPGVHRVVRCAIPWIDPDPGPAGVRTLSRVIGSIRALRTDEAVIFTSFHQSPLPMALALRLAGVRRISAISDDYPGSLLDVRHRVTGDMPEAERNLSLARAAGFRLPGGDDGRLAVREPLPDTAGLTGDGRYVVVHPGASVPARRPSAAVLGGIVTELTAAGHRVVITGTAAERPLAAQVRGHAAAAGPGPVTDLSGRTSLAALASVLAGADAAVAPNTGAAHLAAAVGTPVVSLFAPVVPAARWAPFGVPSVVLGDQGAPCAGSRARRCPVPGHPCLDAVDPREVADAVAALLPRHRDSQRRPSPAGVLL